jgi:hypothetical protein|tara:strand:+ start:5156 stop:5491 length:336 start_codon:yes stop_codon:yes gene_type:complete
MANKPSWQSQQFIEQDSDPLAGFANIMDVMLVFALGVILALVSQSQDLQEHFKLNPELKDLTQMEISLGTELVEAPESIEESFNGQTNGMQSMGQVFKDPKTGKLILISGD